jgi:hypothetical protein
MKNGFESASSQQCLSLLHHGTANMGIALLLLLVACLPKKCENIKFLKTKTQLIYSNKTIYDTCVYSGMSSTYSHNVSSDTSVNKRTVWSAGWASRMSRLVLGSTQPSAYHNGKQTLYHVTSKFSQW